MKIRREKYFRSTSFSLAVFLFVKNRQITGINTLSGTQKEFAFIKDDELDELVWLYEFGAQDDDRLLVQVHEYEHARRELLEKLKKI